MNNDFLKQEKILTVKALSKDYMSGKKKLSVIKEVSFDILKGEFLTIVGPSGAGKSTLLHLIGVLDVPTQGEIYFQENKISELSESDRSRLRNEKFGFIFQFYHLLPELNAIENVALPALIHQRGKRKKTIYQKAGQLLEEVGLLDRLTHRPNQLSGGEQQRVAIARALMNDPVVLLADEPTGNLDAHTGESIQEMLIEFNQKKKCTLVVVTHDEQWVKKSKRVLTMQDGRINESIH